MHTIRYYSRKRRKRFFSPVFNIDQSECLYLRKHYIHTVAVLSAPVLISSAFLGNSRSVFHDTTVSLDNPLSVALVLGIGVASVYRLLKSTKVVAILLQSDQLGQSMTVSPTFQEKSWHRGVRSFLASCWFDQAKLDRLITSLDEYRKKWNATTGDFASQPLHNWASNPADAFRCLACGVASNERGVSDGFFRRERGNWRTL